KHQMAATTLFNQGLRREALAEINQAVMLEPRNSNFQFLLGECLESNGDYRGAHQAYLTCVLIDPENNKEAAARMKAMQDHAGVTASMPQMPPQSMNVGRPAYQPPVQQSYMQPAAQPGIPQPAAPQTPATEQSQSAMFPHKNMYEGGNGPAIAPAQMNFRTHDESGNAAEMQPAPQVPGAPPVQAPQTAMAPAPNSAPAATAADTAFSAPRATTTNDALAKVADSEAIRDYNGAAAALRKIAADNLQNPEIHHRLAVNLMAAGEISEAISEFRIASALNPTKKEYSEDLARAMAIHKRSLMSDATGTANGGMSGVTK
ncbi:MAG TPA: tetratricopeptide repeat protein, partial [Chroococcales cyanobacterium]